MILLKKWVKQKVRSYSYCVNQFLCEKRHKKWNQEYKRTQSLSFNFYIFDLLTSRTQKITWWPPVFQPDYTYFSVMNNSGKFEKTSSTSFYCIIPPQEGTSCKLELFETTNPKRILRSSHQTNSWKQVLWIF